MAQRPAFDVSRMSNASKILLGGGVLLLVDSFLTWQRDCESLSGVEVCSDVHSMWSGSGAVFGLLAGVLVLVLIAWEGLRVADVAVDIGVSVDPGRISAFLGFGVLAFVVLKFLFVLPTATLGAWAGLMLALAIGYGAWMRLQEPAVSVPPAPPSTNGGMPS
jgi:hypothetical protein